MSSCGVWFINHTDDTIVYNHWELGGVTQWLNGVCFQNNKQFGACKFEDHEGNGGVVAAIMFVVPFLYLLMGETQPAFLLVSLTCPPILIHP